MHLHDAALCILQHIPLGMLLILLRGLPSSCDGLLVDDGSTGPAGIDGFLAYLP